uniref:Uncharacterized protein n=1 Tax=Calcidiscus leptoporus TaxID=127549 RepID=A0A7S0IUZ8_9EUKA
MQKNGIDALGARGLSEALARHTSLAVLHLNGNHVGAEGAEALARALSLNSTLETLGLRSNNLRDAGAVALARGLRSATSRLSTLCVALNGVHPDTMKAFARTMEENKSLTDLDLAAHEPALRRAAFTQVESALRLNRHASRQPARHPGYHHPPREACRTAERTEHCSPPPPLASLAARQPSPGTTLAARNVEGVSAIGDVAELLAGCQLDQAQLEAACKWCRETGVTSMRTLIELRLENAFVAALQLKQGHRLRLLARLRPLRAPARLTPEQRRTHHSPLNRPTSVVP